MGGDTDKHVTKPASPYSREEFFDPAKGPREPGAWEVEHYVPRPGDDLAAVAGASRVRGLSVGDLTHFEWGTRSQREANWYLRELCGCTGVDSAGNVKFDDAIYPGARTIDQWLWLPRPAGAFPPRRVAGARGDRFVLSTTRCPLKSGAKPACRFERSAPTTCTAPTDTNWTRVDLGPRWKALEPLIERLLDARGVLITFHAYDIKEKGVPDDRAERWIAIEELALDFLGDQETRSFEKLGMPEQADPTRPRPALSDDPAAGRIDWRGLSNPRELTFAAEHIRVLQAAGRLKSVTIRGFADRTGKQGHNLGLSWRRADWVRTALTDGLGLLDEIPVELVGCGKHHAEATPNKQDPDQRVAVIELEIGPPQEKATDRELKKALDTVDPEGEARVSYQDFLLPTPTPALPDAPRGPAFTRYKYLGAEGMEIPQVHQRRQRGSLDTLPDQDEVDHQAALIREVGRAFIDLLENVVGEANRSWLASMDRHNYLAFMRRRLDSWQPNYHITTLGNALRLPVPGPRADSEEARRIAMNEWYNRYHARYREETRPGLLISFYVAVDDALRKPIKEQLNKPHVLHVPPLRIHFETNQPGPTP